MIRFAIVGSGNIAQSYVRAVANVEGAKVTGIISRNPDKIKVFDPIPLYNDLVSFANYDAVIVCTPNGLHHQSTIKAAHLGKHILCEKPIDITLKAIDNMIDACRKNKVKLGVAYQRRFSSDNPIVKRLLEDEKLGRVFAVDLSIKNYRDDAYYESSSYRGTYAIDGGGPFMQQASHYIDLYYWYFGRPKRLVSKMGTFVHKIEVEDHGAVICEHGNGMISTITASTATKPGFPAKLEIYCEKGYLIMVNDVITEWDIQGLANPSKNADHQNKHTGSATAVVEDTTNHELIISDFVGAIRDDREPLVTGESARNATAIILDIYNSQF